MIGNPYFGTSPFGPNNAMSVDTTKQGMYGQNAMVAPGAYGGDPYTVVGNGANALPGASPLSIQAYRQSMLPFLPQQPQNPYQGMTPFGNQYTRYLMQGGQRQNRLARPVRGDFMNRPQYKFGQQPYQPVMPALNLPYDTVE